jgi:glycerate 2-kinase
VLRHAPTLLDGSLAGLRRDALDVALSGLAAADPGAATAGVVSYDTAADTLSVDGEDYPLSGRGRVMVVGSGKATYPIAVALEQILGSRLAGGAVVVRDPEVRALDRLELICADHPLPTERSVYAAQRILEWAAVATEDDVVITCFTGGSSSLSSLPPQPVSAADKRTLHQQLLSSGLAITEVNAVRKQVSAVKGGRVALAARPARVINLTVSDVAGSPLDSVTDPSVQDRSSAAVARAILEQAQLWDVVPASVRAHLEQDLPTPEVVPEPQTVMLADGATTVAAMSEAAARLGYLPISVSPELEGEAERVGRYLASLALDEARTSAGPVMVLGCGGESVVTVHSQLEFGRGGPNQHAALMAAEVLAGSRAAALFLDTDGSDGGTPFAGALIDGDTSRVAGDVGVELHAAMDLQRSTDACERLGVAVCTGHTGTNVNDLFVLAAEGGLR